MDRVRAEFEPTTAERIARNDDIFRKANERIRESAERYQIQERIPFLCECADPRCTEIVRVDLATYSDIRSHPRRFINTPGHDTAVLERAAVVSTEDGFVIVEKIGVAGEIAERLDGERAP